MQRCTFAISAGLAGKQECALPATTGMERGGRGSGVSCIIQVVLEGEAQGAAGLREMRRRWGSASLQHGVWRARALASGLCATRLNAGAVAALPARLPVLPGAIMDGVQP